MITVYTRFYTPLPGEKIPALEHRIGRELLATGLKELYGIHVDKPDETSTPPAALPDTRIAVGSHQKPYLPAYPDIHFNISHCRGLVACAFAPFPVGIDVEHIRPFRDHLLSRVLTPEEQTQLETLGTTEEKRQEWFFRFWTLKESRIKQSGTGMSVRLSSFSFRISPEGTVTGSDEDLSFWQQLLRDRYILSACIPKCQGGSSEHFLQIIDSCK